MNKRTEQDIIGHLAIGGVEALRLIAEFAEDAKLLHAGRESLMARLRQVMRAGVQAVALAEQTVSFAECVASSLAARAHRRPSTRADLRSYTNRMLAYGDWTRLPLRGITRDQCGKMLNAVFGHSSNVFRKAQVILHSLFEYGRRQGWCVGNVAEGVALPPPPQEQTITPLSMEQIESLYAASGRSQLQPMRPALLLMLWCGVRPGEVQRLCWGDIDTAAGVMYVTALAGKTCNVATQNGKIIRYRGNYAIIMQSRCKPMKRPGVAV